MVQYQTGNYVTISTNANKYSSINLVLKLFKKYLLNISLPTLCQELIDSAVKHTDTDIREPENISFKKII